MQISETKKIYDCSALGPFPKSTKKSLIVIVPDAPAGVDEAPAEDVADEAADVVEEAPVAEAVEEAPIAVEVDVAPVADVVEAICFCRGSKASMFIGPSS